MNKNYIKTNLTLVLHFIKMTKISTPRLFFSSVFHYQYFLSSTLAFFLVMCTLLYSVFAKTLTKIKVTI